MSAAHERWRPLALPLAVSVLFSGSYVAGKLVADTLDPLDATFARYLFALAVLAGLIPRFGTAALRLVRRDVPAVVLLGLTGVIGYHGLFFASLHYTTAGNTAIINASSPVLTAAAAAVLGERLGSRAYLGVAIACAGTLVLVTGADPARLAALAFNRGDLLMLGAVGCWVAYALVLRRLLERNGGFALTFHATLAAVLMLAAITWDASTWAPLRAMSTTTLAAVAYMGIFASGLGYLLYTFSVARLGPTRTAGVVYCTVPVFVALLALAMLGEPITWIALASIALVITGLRLLGAR